MAQVIQNPGFSESSATIANILQLAGQAEKQRQTRYKTDKGLAILASGGKIEDVIAALQQDDPNYSNNPLISALQRIGGANMQGASPAVSALTETVLPVYETNRKSQRADAETESRTNYYNNRAKSELTDEDIQGYDEARQWAIDHGMPEPDANIKFKSLIGEKVYKQLMRPKFESDVNRLINGDPNSPDSVDPQGLAKKWWNDFAPDLKSMGITPDVLR